MLTPRAYLDWNATTPLHPAAKAAMMAAMDVVGNPSSIHLEGRAARQILESARADIAKLVGGVAENVVFTSGATEAANALFSGGLTGCCGVSYAADLTPLVLSVEHAAVLGAASGAWSVPVLGSGVVDFDALSQQLAQAPALVGVQLANNETGIVQPVAEIARIVQAAGGALVVDAVQGPGKLAFDLPALGADALFLSAHKFGGPKGVGAIVFSSSRTRIARAMMRGGGQESGQRGGTENIIGIAGMGAAARVVLADVDAGARMQTLRDGFEAELLAAIPDATIIGRNEARLVNTCLFAVPDMTAEKLLIAFDLDGIAVSSGSACSSGKVKASHVLAAMGLPDWVHAGAIRVSIGPTTTKIELERCLASLMRHIQRQRKKVHAA